MTLHSLDRSSNPKHSSRHNVPEHTHGMHGQMARNPAGRDSEGLVSGSGRLGVRLKSENPRHPALDTRSQFRCVAEPGLPLPKYALRSTCEQSSVPAYRFGSGSFYQSGGTMVLVDEDVVLASFGDDAWHMENCGSTFPQPLITKGSCRCHILGIPTRQRRRR